MWLRAKHRVLVACSWRLNDADFVGIYEYGLEGFKPRHRREGLIDRRIAVSWTTSAPLFMIGWICQIASGSYIVEKVPRSVIFLDR